MYVIWIKFSPGVVFALEKGVGTLNYNLCERLAIDKIKEEVQFSRNTKTI